LKNPGYTTVTYNLTTNHRHPQTSGNIDPCYLCYWIINLWFSFDWNTEES